MNSPRSHAVLTLRFLFSLFILAATLALLIRGASNSAKVYPLGTVFQDDEKSLSIERYGNEPLELVELKIREHSVKDSIKPKIKDQRNRPVLDNVKFKERDDWFKNVKIRLRNVSGRSVCGLNAALYFQPDGVRMVFKMELKPAAVRDLFKQPLQSGEEIDLDVNEGSVNQAMRFMFQYGVDVNQTAVSLAVHTVYFSEDFGWGQGSFMRRDPYNPNNWNAVDMPETPPSPGPSPAPSEASQLFQTAGFKFMSMNPNPAQFLNYCQAARGGVISWACNQDQNNSCDTISEIGNGAAGFLSSVGELGNCVYHPGPTQTTCDTQTTNYVLRVDPNCATPSPTPTPEETPTPDLCPTQPPTCPSGQMPVLMPYPFCYQCLPNPFGTPEPTPTCVPNDSYNFGVNPCCSGYSVDNICKPNPGFTPCSPNGFTCFTSPSCCSRYCDMTQFRCAAPTPEPPPDSCPSTDCNEGGNGFPSDYCAYPNGCPEPYYSAGACCLPPFTSPILIDVDGSGFELTNTQNGVWFGFYGDGRQFRFSWTGVGSTNAWLALDRNGDDRVNDGRELFGNFTPQGPSNNPNGFLALAEFDKPETGGNHDGVINSRDSIFAQLRLWQDANHNGISEPGELHRLSDFNVESIALDYRESRQTDRWGNVFRYRAKVYGNNHADLGRWAYDVFLLTDSTTVRGRALRVSNHFPNRADIWQLLGNLGSN